MPRKQWIDKFTLTGIREHRGAIMPAEPGMIKKDGGLSAYFARFLDREGLIGSHRARIRRFKESRDYVEIRTKGED